VLEPFETSTTSKPLGMVWCGKDSLVLYWRNMGLLMVRPYASITHGLWVGMNRRITCSLQVGPFGDYIHFPYKQALALVPEPDCCRIGTPPSRATFNFNHGHLISYSPSVYSSADGSHEQPV
jgi:hypothetical protein